MTHSLRTAWLAVALLWPVALLNYLDRQMLAAMKYSVMQDIPSIGLEANWGYMLGQFKWVYAAMSPIGGYIADRFSRRYVICASLFVWSAITWATGRVTSYETLLWTRTLMGISEAFYIPAALALIADYHTGDTRSRAVGVHQTAIYAGIIIGGFSGYVAEDPDFGWRFAFDLTGIVGVCYALPLLVLLRDPPALAIESAAEPEGHVSIRTAARDLFGNRSFLLLVACFTLPAQAGWIVKDWMPAILKDKFHIGQGHAGVSATLYVNLASLVGAFVGGWLADRLMHRTVRGRIYISAIGMSLLIPALFGVGDAPTLGVAIAFLVLFGIGWGFFDTNNMPILSQIARSDLRATGYGIMNMVSTSTGGFADWGFGVLRDREVPLNLIFGMFAAAAFVSVGLMLLIRPQVATSTGT
ncbi:MAG TPA: MFS transporter [Pirellulales bacterium]|jgi:MFS family permease|nr:MFS transporter [Pirellulales bacterium]